MKKCGICREPYRVGGRVFASREGKPQLLYCCKSCLKQTITIHVGDACARCTCGEKATRCEGCTHKLANDFALASEGVPGAIKRLEGMVKAHRSGATPVRGLEDESRAAIAAWAEGIEAAIALLKSGRF